MCFGYMHVSHVNRLVTANHHITDERRPDLRREIMDMRRSKMTCTHSRSCRRQEGNTIADNVDNRRQVNTATAGEDNECRTEDDKGQPSKVKELHKLQRY